MKQLTFGIVAGELSGDILGAGLIRAIRCQYPDARFVGIGGPRMLAEGMDSLFPMEELSVMGLVEVLGRLPRLLKIKKALVERFAELDPHCFVGVDAPDFNLRLEASLKPLGIPTVHYVSPSVWAWRPKRIFKIDAATDQVLALLPFEKAFYDKYNVSCEFIGHTLADQIPLENPQAPIRNELGLAPTDRVLALLPGSRGGEMGRLGPDFIAVAARLQQRNPELKILVPLANDHRRTQFESLLAEAERQTGSKPELILLEGQSREAMVASDAILLASGTATLEAMLVKRPMVVAYKIAPTSYRIAKALKLMQIDRFSLPNLLGQNHFGDKDLVPELIQHDCTVDNMVAEVEAKLEMDPTELVDKFTELHQLIRRDASERAADAVLDVIRHHRGEEALA